MLREMVEKKGLDEENYLISETEETHQKKIIAEGVKVYEETRLLDGKHKGQTFAQAYPHLGDEHFDGQASERDKMVGAATAIVMKNQMEYLDQMKRRHGEAVVLNALGDIAPNVIDVVRIFFPNLIANSIAEIQPLTSINGTVITIKPRYTNTAGGVTAGQEVFTNRTDGSYASDEVTQEILPQGGTGDTLDDVTLAGTLQMKPVRPGTVIVKKGTEVVGTDNGDGGVTGSGLGTGSTVNYSTGAINLTFASNLGANDSVTVSYRWNIESSRDDIREMEIGINLVPVQAKPHPLRIRYSVEAGLAAQASYNLDVQDMVSNLASQFIRKERDYRLVTQITNAAESVTNLNFDCQIGDGTGAEITKTQHFQDWSIKLSHAKSVIFEKNNRGTVSFILCGINAENVISRQANFVRDPQIIPVGAHRTGQIDGSIDVILDAGLEANTYVFGYRGMQTGDAAMILAEWIPIYLTPVFQNSNLENSQGMLSMYDTLLNNPAYYVKGKLSNFSA